MNKIQFSPEALKDLLDTKAYITEELCNEKAANNVISKILKQIRQLEAFPQMGASLSAIVGFETDYRFLVCGHYTAFYRMEKGAVNIVRVLYGRRDYMRILFGEPQQE